MTKSAIIDVTQLLMGARSMPSEGDGYDLSCAFIKCLENSGGVDLQQISAMTGLSCDEVIHGLDGVIYQDPQYFEQTLWYDRYAGWIPVWELCSGNVRVKLSTACRINGRYGGAFDSVIKELKNALPEKVYSDKIHIHPGAPWITVDIHRKFLKDVLELKHEPEIIRDETTGEYKILVSDELTASSANNVTYAVRRDANAFGYGGVYARGDQLYAHILNGTPKTVSDSEYDGDKYKSVYNPEKTAEAQDIMDKLCEKFEAWCYKDPKRLDHLMDLYNNNLVAYNRVNYRGGFLSFPGLNPSIRLRDYQKDAVAHKLLGPKKLLLAHDVGTGKTYESIVIVHEMHRIGKCKKAIVAVPNSKLLDFENDHRSLYKDDNIMVIQRRDFSASKRAQTLRKIRDSDCIAVYIAQSSFDMIDMSYGYYEKKFKNEKQSFEKAIKNLEYEISVASSRGDIIYKHYQIEMIKRNIKELKRKFDKFKKEYKETSELCYDELGFDMLIVDEAHNYKNIPVITGYGNTAGIGGKGSKKCISMLEKVHFTEHVVFGTATPLTNSIADLYAMQMYLQPEMLKFHHLDSFESWVSTFCNRTVNIECNVDGTSNRLRPVARFTEFKNLTELIAMFAQVCDFYYPDKSEEDLPEYDGPVNVAVPINVFQQQMIREISERADKIHNREVKREVDNMLKITIDGRMVALDIRLIDKYSGFTVHGMTKVKACADKVKELYDKYPDTAQIVFSDLGTPKSSFNIYDAFADELVSRGIPREEITYIHEAASDSAKMKLFRAVNKGEIRIIIGSTPKLGLGVNIQEKLIALHHLSVPWRPADLTQREGRILRSGNTCEKVFIFRYYTEGTFDAYSWQLLENKQRFIASFLSGVVTGRSFRDISDTALSYAEVKMLSVGNPLVKKRVEAANMYERERVAYSRRISEIDELKQRREAYIAENREIKARVERMNLDYRLGRINKREFPDAERAIFGRYLLEAVRNNINKAKPTYYGVYRGFVIELPKYMAANSPYINLRTYNGGEYRCDIREDITNIGITNSMDKRIASLNRAAKKAYLRLLENKRQISLAEAAVREKKAENISSAEKIDELKSLVEKLDLEIDNQ